MRQVVVTVAVGMLVAAACDAGCASRARTELTERAGEELDWKDAAAPADASGLPALFALDAATGTTITYGAVGANACAETTGGISPTTGACQIAVTIDRNACNDQTAQCIVAHELVHAQQFRGMCDYCTAQFPNSNLRRYQCFQCVSHAYARSMEPPAYSVGCACEMQPGNAGRTAAQCWNGYDYCASSRNEPTTNILCRTSGTNPANLTGKPDAVGNCPCGMNGDYPTCSMNCPRGTACGRRASPVGCSCNAVQGAAQPDASSAAAPETTSELGAASTVAPDDPAPAPDAGADANPTDGSTSSPAPDDGDGDPCALPDGGETDGGACWLVVAY